MKLLLIIAISLIVLISFYRFVRDKKLQKSSEQSEALQLKKLHDNEAHLREEISRLQNKLRQMFEDPVTHLLGWQLFEDRLNQSIKDSSRHHFYLAVMFIDLDYFKVINDALGYEMGDLLLKEIAGRLRACIRQVDSISRFTKDTFVVLLTQLAKPETAAIIAQRILQAVSQPVEIKEKEIFVTACIGISVFPTDAEEATSLLRSADHALHLAKEKNRHVYQFYQEKMHAESQRELALNLGLSRDQLFQELVLLYQPIVNVENETILCMDVLIHWKHAEFGLVSPEELMQYSERQRKANVITEWLLRMACKQFISWRSLGFSPTLLGIPITIKQLENSHFVYNISQILQELEFQPTWLLLEIKEKFSYSSYEALEKSFNMLQYLGVKIAIDGFGSGIFSLCDLKKFPVNYLKLDSGLIDDIEKNPITIEIIKATLALAERLSIQVVTQGIESEAQLALIKTLGCKLMQGKLLGAPLSEQEIASKMTTAS